MPGLYLHHMKVSIKTKEKKHKSKNNHSHNHSHREERKHINFAKRGGVRARSTPALNDKKNGTWKMEIKSRVKQ
jgi:hypothetical protein